MLGFFGLGRRQERASKRFTPEQIISKLREAKVLLAQGEKMGVVCKRIAVTEQTYYRWRKEYGGLRLDQAKRLKVLEKENVRLKKLVADLSLDNQIFKRGVLGKLLSPAKRRRAVNYVRERLGEERVSERRACRVLGQARSTQRREPVVREDEPLLVARMVGLACEYGRYGYRRMTTKLRWEGWWVNHKRVERLWKREGLKVPSKQPKRRRLWAP